MPVAPALWVDEFTRQHLAFRVERRMGAADVIDMLDLAVLAHGAPQVLRADNGGVFNCLCIRLLFERIDA